MVESSRASVSSFPRGFQFPTFDFRISPEDARRYAEAVESQAPDLPPLAVAAFALRRLLETMELPPGSLHASQDVEFIRTATTDRPLTVRALVAQRSERAGFVAAVIEFTVDDGEGPLLKGRSTVLAPLEAAR